MTKAIILAAGRGSRLHPYTDDKPKCLTELAGMTLIGRQIATLRDAGITDIVIATGYMREQFALPATRQVHNPDWADTNMVETLFCGRAEFGDDVIVCYSDIVYDPAVIAALIASPHGISVIYDRQWRALWEMRFDDPLDDAETFRIDDAGRIIEIGAKAKTIEEIEGQYIGLMRFKGAGVAKLAAARANWSSVERDWMKSRPVRKAYMTDLLMEMIHMGHDVMGVPIDGGWLEIDTVSDFEKAAALVESGGINRFFDPSRTPLERQRLG